MNELLTWGVPIAVSLALVGLGFQALQSITSTDEFWIARGSFVFAGLIALARLIFWGLTTHRSPTTRLIACFIIGGLLLVSTVEAVRYVNRKSDRWIRSNQVPAEQLPRPATSETPLSEAQPARTLPLAREGQVGAKPATRRTSPEELYKRAETIKPSPQPNIVCTGTRIIRRGINLENNSLIDEEYDERYGEPSTTVGFVDVALARFYYKPDVDVDPDMEVKAHISFRDSHGEVRKEVNDALWFRNEDEYQSFSTAERHELIVALISLDRSKGIISYEYNTESYDQGYPTGDYLVPELDGVEGKDFRVNVELICKRWQQVKLTKSFPFTLSLEPELKFEEIKQSEESAATTITSAENHAKREYKIERLKELIKEEAEANKAGFVDLTESYFGALFQHEARVKRFLADYFDEAHVKQYEEKGVVFLEQLLRELLDA